MQQEVKDIIKEIALEEDIPVSDVEKIIAAQNKVVVRTIKKGPVKRKGQLQFKTIRLPSWGIFYITDKKRQRYASTTEQ